MEKDRFMEQFEDADEWTTLSMLQAITLYSLLRIFDEDLFSVDFDHELVRAMTVKYPNPKNVEAIEKLNPSLQEIAIKAEQQQLLCPAEVKGWRPGWKEWVLLESKRRRASLCSPFSKNQFC